MLPPTALYCEWQERGACVAGGMVQSDDDEEMEPMHGIYRTLQAELEVQRAIKGAELTAFFLSL